MLRRRRNATFSVHSADLYIEEQLIENDVVKVLRIRAKPGIISPAVFVCRARAE